MSNQQPYLNKRLFGALGGAAAAFTLVGGLIYREATVSKVDIDMGADPQGMHRVYEGEVRANPLTGSRSVESKFISVSALPDKTWPNYAQFDTATINDAAKLASEYFRIRERYEDAGIFTDAQVIEFGSVSRREDITNPAVIRRMIVDLAKIEAAAKKVGADINGEYFGGSSGDCTASPATCTDVRSKLYRANQTVTAATNVEPLETRVIAEALVKAAYEVDQGIKHSARILASEKILAHE